MGVIKKHISRILEPIFLGSLSNIFVNIIFDFQNPDFVIDEFVMAWIFALPITELNRLINKILNKKMNWTQFPIKRFLSHLGMLTLSLLFVINVLGNAYIWFIGDEFYTWKEMSIINMVTLFVALLMTFLQFGKYFYDKWNRTQIDLKKSNDKIDDIISKVGSENTIIEYFKGNSTIRINANEIQFAKIEFGVVKLYLKDNFGIYQSTLTDLAKKLPEYHFFRVNRSMIIHRDAIASITPSTYGKIEIKIIGDINSEDILHISRLKASEFRKWYNSSLILI